MRTLIAIVAAAGCGGHAPARPTVTPAPAVTTTDAPPAPEPVAPAPSPAKKLLPEQVEAVVRGYEAIAAAAGPGVRCPEVAKAIAATAESTRGDRAALHAAARGDLAADVNALMSAAAPRLTPAVATLDAAVRRCQREPEIGRALDAFDR